MNNNAGVNSSKIKFCDLRCESASFPEETALDGSGSCRTFIALWCNQLQKYVTKNSPCEVIFGARRPKSNF
jgi:hypothetical protein